MKKRREMNEFCRFPGVGGDSPTSPARCDTFHDGAVQYFSNHVSDNIVPLPPGQERIPFV